MKRIATWLLVVGAFLPTTAAAQQPVPPVPPEPTLSVLGTGEVDRVPDRAILMLAVENVAPTAREAAQQNAAAMDQLVAALRGLGLRADAIRTVSYDLQPRYDHREMREGGPPIITGYQAMNRVQVTIDSVPRVGAIIDAAIAAGSNRVEGLMFTLRDTESARLEALRRATEDARSEATAVAEALDRRLGQPVAVSVGQIYFPPPIPYGAAMRSVAMEAAAVPTPVEPGTQTVTATVNIVYQLLPR